MGKPFPGGRYRPRDLSLVVVDDAVKTGIMEPPGIENSLLPFSGFIFLKDTVC